MMKENLMKKKRRTVTTVMERRTMTMTPVTSVMKTMRIMMLERKMES